MSPAYERATSDSIPEAAHVADPFHVVKLFNGELTRLRRDLYSEIKDVPKKRFEGKPVDTAEESRKPSRQTR